MAVPPLPVALSEQLSTREAFERRLADFSASANTGTPEAAQGQWLSLLRFTVSAGEPRDLTAVLQVADAGLAKPVGMDLLFAALDLVPVACQWLSSGAAAQLLRQCLLWAGPHPLDDWLALLERLRRACRPLSMADESELKRVLLRLLGVDAAPPDGAMRLAMAFGAGLFCQETPTLGASDGGLPHHHARPDPEVAPTRSSSDGGHPPLMPVCPFLSLPPEVQQAILRWVLPDPASAKRHGQGLKSVCKDFKRLVDPLLEQALPPYWSHADRLAESPTETPKKWVDAMSCRFFEPLRDKYLLKSDEKSDAESDALLASMVREANCMAWAVCQLRDIDALGAATTALFDAVLEHELGKIYLHDLPHTFARMACLVCLDEPHFGALLASWLACIERWPVDERFFSDIRFHVEACAPTDIQDGFHRRMEAALRGEAPRGTRYLKALLALSPVHCFDKLRRLRPCFSGASSLSWLQLIGVTHELSEERGRGLVESEAWWCFAQHEVALFLCELHEALPNHAPLPLGRLLVYVPLQLLRGAFQVLKPPQRQALLQRPPVFSLDGQCLQGPLLCDYLLDQKVDLATRLALLRWCECQGPEVTQGLQAFAFQWKAPSRQPEVRYMRRRSDGRETFREDLVKRQARLEQATGDETSAWEAWTALVPRASRAEDLGQILALAKAHALVPMPITAVFWFEVFDWMPLICQNGLEGMPSPLRMGLAGIEPFSEDDRLLLLKGFSEASLLIPLRQAMGMWMVLRQACVEAELPSGLQEKMGEAQLDLLERFFHDLFAPTEGVPALQVLETLSEELGDELDDALSDSFDDDVDDGLQALNRLKAFVDQVRLDLDDRIERQQRDRADGD